MKEKERMLDKNNVTLMLEEMTKQSIGKNTISRSELSKKRSLQEKGITLIALVVTIIILLILAGVTLNIALSDGGLFSKTQEAADKYKQAQSDEEEEIEKIKYATEGIYITDIEEISTAEEFREISQKVSGGTSFEGTLIKLTSDVNLGGEEWTPIGSEENPFKGAFDGGGHKITNLTISTSNECQGLFGYNAGTIQNVGIESGTLTVGPKSGGIAGCNTGTIENCYNKANITCNNCTDKAIGGIVGAGR